MDTNSDKKTDQKPIELKPVNSAALLTTNGSNAENSEDDVIIGRFRKISSAKSMAITNGNSKYPDDILADIPAKLDNEDVEQGLLFKNIENNENDNFADSKAKTVSAANRSKVSKSSFRDTEKPSRFRDNPSITRFQMAELERNKEQQGAETEDEDADEEAGEDSDDPLTTGNDTKYGKSFRHFTREALPRLDNYRNVLSLHAAPRPTLDELHNASLSRKPGGQTLEKDGQFGNEPTGASLKFGWLQGVLMRCLLNIWGVMLFLRLSWVVGQAGVVQSVVLILTTTAVTIITALSMSAISTNGVIKGGGTYYMISRSLGPEFGGSIGLIFSAANAIACAMYVVGFSESLRDLMASFGTYIIDGGAKDLSITGSITIVVLTVIVVVGMEWEAKAQIGLLVILLFAIADFIIGTLVGPKSDLEVTKGFLGYNNTLMYENLGSDYRPANGVSHDFFSVFAIFFPAATGILAGANISGDLKDPQKSIPKGTLLAIVLTTFSYILIAILVGWTVARDASGDITELVNGTFLDCSNRTCRYGLHNSFQVIELVSGFGPLIYAGCFAATLSSALASLVSAPKVFQALCKDKLYPGIYWFAKGYGKNNEPVRGYILTFFIAIGFVLIGDLNTIAPLISNFFLAAYMLINFSTFHASLAKPVGWRPTFQYYNMWLSLFGAIICVAVMFLISWATALLTFAVVLALYLIVSYRKPDVNWGSTTQAQTYKNALTGVHQLNRVTDHVKNYRPQILVLTGFPTVRPALTDFTYLLTKGLSLMVCGHIVENQVSNKTRNALNNRAYQWFTKQKVKAFYVLVDDAKLQSGASALVQATGLGKLKPNILLMGYKTDWNTCPNEELVQYVEVMHKALDVHMALAILRVDGGLDCSSTLDESLQACLAELQGSNKDITAFKLGNSTYRESSESLGRSRSVIHASQASSLSDISMVSNTVNHSPAPVSKDPGANDQSAHNVSTKNSDKEPKSAVAAAVSAMVGAVTGAVGHGARRASSIVSGVPLNHFTKKQSGHIDVWWLYDDGGLTLLLPYIISTRRNWSSCRLRVFTLANKKAEMEFEERSMASLLSKFRIDYSDLKMIPDITKKPQESTIAYFNQLIAKFLVPENPSEPDSAPITEADLLAAQDRTYRHLRLRELIAQHSDGARLICVTLPMPRRRLVTPPQLYLAWLEALSGGKGMPPVLLVRGNQTSVLTFYS